MNLLIELLCRTCEHINNTYFLLDLIKKLKKAVFFPFHYQRSWFFGSFKTLIKILSLHKDQNLQIWNMIISIERHINSIFNLRAEQYHFSGNYSETFYHFEWYRCIFIMCILKKMESYMIMPTSRKVFIKC